ncbi:sugar phosphate isomerase/epimerase [Nocardioides carbamazepini]|uniref:sugar phosphate isomerase/epimerase family protein n=1 Tax=Nocardioides carbamazepini TaxID=2854259 RepID=UPI002149CDEF|nr:sugar phosphate isomerase/epimerase [Nocardioides carbamazepini]MCR1785704.1 sugar phosphate isomerase/epimerase [Nocardioides carbamazepini]
MPVPEPAFRIGTDSSKFPAPEGTDAAWLLERAAKVGLEGVFFRSALELSPTLDVGELAALRQQADDLDLYLEVGAAKINPFAAPEAPEIRALGDGDYLFGIERIVAACAAAGIHEIWAATANYKFDLAGRLACDRYRTDVTWHDQLRATAKVMAELAPVLRAHGSHLNIETHEEITTFELVRLVEEGGPDAFGITFDTANVLIRGEDPVAAAHRVAPYTRQTHVRDGALFFTDQGLCRVLAPCGQGVIDWSALLSALLVAPRRALSIEGIMGRRFQLPIPIHDPLWHAGQPDMTTVELAELVRLARGYEAAVARGERRTLASLAEPADDAERQQFVLDSVAHLRAAAARIGAGPE